MINRKLFLLCLILIILIATTVVYMLREHIYRQTSQLVYRLGDVVIFPPMRESSTTNFLYRTYYRNTIAGQYMIKAKKCNDFKLLHKIIKDIKVKNPPDKEDTLVIHLRAGDVVDKIYSSSIDELLDGKYYYHYLYSYKKLDDELMKIDKNIVKNIIIVSGYHISGEHSRSEEYINKLKKYMETKGFNVSLRVDKHTADEDLVWMSKSKNFLRSGGNYSILINEMVKLSGGNILKETDFHEQKRNF